MSVEIVAELGQNMQGSVEVAKDLVEMAAHPHRHDFREDEVYGADTIKLCKRDLDRELSREAENESYEGRQSFGPTYGEHREALELSWAECSEIYEYAKHLGLNVGITLCASTLVDELPFEPDFFKIASRDLRHTPLLDRMAETELPLVLSTGMAELADLRRALEVVTAHHEDITILHCVSSYPTPPDVANVRTVAWLKTAFPRYRIGYSDHTQGLVASMLAVALGAEMIERHVTLWRGMRGSDHQPALSSDGLWRLCRDVRLAEQMLGEYGMDVPDAVEPAREKLERSICAASDMQPGTVVGSSNTMLLSPGTGISWHERGELFGKYVTEPVESKTLLSSTMVEAA